MIFLGTLSKLQRPPHGRGTNLPVTRAYRVVFLLHHKDCISVTKTQTNLHQTLIMVQDIQKTRQRHEFTQQISFF